MAKHIYIIQAHKNAGQLLRMIDSLRGEDVEFFVHIDLKSDIGSFLNLIRGEDIIFIKERVDCIWGDFSQVQATLNLISAVLEVPRGDLTRITFISGQDYPIKSKDHISKFLKENIFKNFITIENLEDSGRHHLKRIKSFKINHSNRRADYTLVSVFYLKNTIKSLLNGKLKLKDLMLLFKTKKFPSDHKQYRGSNWWSLNIVTLKKIVKYYEKHRIELERYYQSTICADETFFHTIIMRLRLDDKKLIIEPSLTYDNWTRNQVDLPVTFKLDDFEELISQPSGKLFARKFDVELSSEILTKLDKINK